VAVALVVLAPRQAITELQILVVVVVVLVKETELVELVARELL
jgi:hypothetical protein